MTKVTFLLNLRRKLLTLSEKEREESLSFYSEMIDDRIEEGMSESEAVASIGSPDAIADEILTERRNQEKSTEVHTQRRWKAWEIVLLVLGSPVWASLLIALFAVIFSLFVALWCVVVSCWVVFPSLLVSGVGGVVFGAFMAFKGNFAFAFALIGVSVFAVGLSVFAFYGAKYLTRGAWTLTRKCGKLFARHFRRKEER